MNYVIMTDSRKTVSGAVPPAETPAPSQRKPQRAFDLWLNRGLHKLFDDVTSEPVPDELLKLIENDREKD